MIRNRLKNACPLSQLYKRYSKESFRWNRKINIFMMLEGRINHTRTTNKDQKTTKETYKIISMIHAFE